MKMRTLISTFAAGAVLVAAVAGLGGSAYAEMNGEESPAGVEEPAARRKPTTPTKQGCWAGGNYYKHGAKETFRDVDGKIVEKTCNNGSWVAVVSQFPSEPMPAPGPALPAP